MHLRIQLQSNSTIAFWHWPHLAQSLLPGLLIGILSCPRQAEGSCMDLSVWLLSRWPILTWSNVQSSYWEGCAHLVLSLYYSVLLLARNGLSCNIPSDSSTKDSIRHRLSCQNHSSLSQSDCLRTFHQALAMECFLTSATKFHTWLSWRMAWTESLYAGVIGHHYFAHIRSSQLGSSPSSNSSVPVHSCFGPAT